MGVFVGLSCSTPLTSPGPAPCDLRAVASNLQIPCAASRVGNVRTTVWVGDRPRRCSATWQWRRADSAMTWDPETLNRTALPNERHGELDRKSTRLNSSH